MEQHGAEGTLRLGLASRVGDLVHWLGDPLLGDAERSPLEKALGWVGRLLWKAALVLYAGFIFWLSSRPIPEGLPLFPQGDKLWHFLEYFLFGLLAWRAFLPQSKASWAWAIFLSLGYAGSDELHQLFVPARTASFLDWAVDSLGIAGGLLLGSRLWGLHFRSTDV